jgi:ABC-2 type transport system permease protein
MFFRLTYNEIVKIMRKWRSLIGFGVLAILLPLIMWGFQKGANGIEQDLTRGLQDSFYVVGSFFNGFIATYIVMNFLWVHIPFLITLVAGDVVAGEGSSGTFRITLIRPVSRSKILSAKLMATFIYTLALVCFFAIMSLGLGTLWLGTGDLLVMQEGLLILPPEIAWARFFISFLLAFGVMMVVACLCFMFSSMVNNGIGPMIGAMAVIIIGLAVSNIPLDIFDSIKPYLFTSYFDIWNKAFMDPIPWKEIGQDGIILSVYAGIFVLLSYWVFTRRDILT